MANFYCPECSEPSLVVDIVIELPPDSRSDEIDLQLLKCEHCGLKATGFYEESRRGSGESIDHYGRRVNRWWYQGLKWWIKRCPHPRNRRCDCAVHKDLGGKDKTGRLRLFKGVDRGDTFALTYPTQSTPQKMVETPPPITSIGGHLLTPNEIGLLGFQWPPDGVDGPAFQPDDSGRVNLDEALNQLGESLAFWQRESNAAGAMARQASSVSSSDYGDFKDARGELNRKVAGLRAALKEVERLIARLDDTD